MQDDVTTRIALLIYKYVYDKLTRNEQNELDQWLHSSVENQALFNKLTDEKYRLQMMLSQTDEPDDELWSLLTKKIPGLPPTPAITAPLRSTRIYYYYAAAAVVLVITSIIVFNTIVKKVATSVVYNTFPQRRATALPHERVYTAITLEINKDSIINIENKPTGIMYANDMIRINKFDDQIVYEYVDANDSPPASHVIYTPRGKTYQLTQLDKSKIFLSTASSIEFLAPFQQNERRMELKGAAEFTVAHNSSPYIVLAKGNSFRALGTQFSISAYPKAPEVSTLVTEGSIKMKNPVSSVTIKKGQFVTIDSNGRYQLQKEFNMNVRDLIYGVPFEYDNASFSKVVADWEPWCPMEIEVIGNQIPEIHYDGLFLPQAPLKENINHLMKYFSVSIKVDSTAQKIVIDLQK